MEDEILQFEQYAQHAADYLITNSPRLLIAALLIATGMLAARYLANLVNNFCSKKRLDITLTRFFSSTTRLFVVGLFVILAINKIGIEITPFLALIGASAFGLSLAVQGPVSNYGAGIVLIITRPFKVDDTLTVHGNTGLVQAVNLGNTVLVTEDGQEVTIPNRKILGEILTNSFQLLVVEGVVGISYDSDPEAAIRIIREAVLSVAAVSKDKSPQIGIQAFGESSIDIGYRYYVPTSHYYNILYAVNLAVFKSLKQANITIPFPQRDVHFVRNETSDQK